MTWVFGAAQRAERLAQSSPFAIAALVAANLVPLLGVLFLGWDIGMILTVYWIENGIVGVINVAKMARAAGDPARVEWPSRAYAMLAFAGNYGAFWLVHGILVGGIAGLARGGGGGGVVGTGAFQGPGGIPFGAAGLDPLALGLTALALTLSHGVSYFVNFIGRGEYRSVTVEAQSNAPYGRMLVLHVTIVVGSFAMVAAHAPAGLIVVMVVLKIVLDLAFHLRDRTRAAARANARPAAVIVS